MDGGEFVYVIEDLCVSSFLQCQCQCCQPRSKWPVIVTCLLLVFRWSRMYLVVIFAFFLHSPDKNKNTAAKVLLLLIIIDHAMESWLPIIPPWLWLWQYDMIMEIAPGNTCPCWWYPHYSSPSNTQVILYNNQARWLSESAYLDSGQWRQWNINQMQYIHMYLSNFMKRWWHLAMTDIKCACIKHKTRGTNQNKSLVISFPYLIHIACYFRLYHKTSERKVFLRNHTWAELPDIWFKSRAERR